MPTAQIQSFSIIDLPTSKIIFSNERSQHNPTYSLQTLLPTLITKIQTSDNQKPIFLKPGASSYLFISVDIAKTAYILGFSPAEIPIETLENLMKSLIEAYQLLVHPISFASKRIFEEKFEFLASETEKNLQKFTGFEKVHAEIQEINNEMQKNITKMVFQQENLIQMEKKTEKLAELAGKFKENATELKVKYTEGSSVGFWIFMAALVLVIFAVLIGILVSSDDTEGESIGVVGNFTNSTTSLQHFIAKTQNS